MIPATNALLLAMAATVAVVAVAPTKEQGQPALATAFMASVAGIALYLALVL